MGNLKFTFRPHKAAELTSLIFKLREKNVLSNIFVNKMFYVANRICLIRHGRPVTGGHGVAMENGPLISEFNDFTKGKIEPQLWAECFAMCDNRKHIRTLRDVEFSELSLRDIKCVEEANIFFGGCEDYDWPAEAIHKTHQFDEWIKFYRDGEESHSYGFPWDFIIKSEVLECRRDTFISLAEEKESILAFWEAAS